jgi:hypothetical protein
MAQAETRLWFGVGQGMSDTLIQSQSIAGADAWQIGIAQQHRLPVDAALFAGADFAHEVYISHISGRDSRKLIAWRPTVTQSIPNSHYFWQLGLGLSYFDGKTMDTIQLSTRGQFALLAGFGFYLDENQQHSLSLRYNHYSNAYLKSPNQGLDYWSIDVTVWQF